MAVASIDYIINEMHEANLNCWNIKDGKALVGEQDDDSKDVTTSASMLKNKLENLGSGYITVNLSGVCKKNRKAGETLKIRTYTVIIGGATKAPVAVSGIDSRELAELRESNKKLEMQLIESRYQQKLDDLNKKIEGLQSDEDNPIGRLETILIPIITEIFTGSMARSSTSVGPVINGIEENNLIDKWLEVDSEAIKVLEKIVSLAVNNPSMYKQYKPILLSL
jgi:hypothetical protein